MLRSFLKFAQRDEDEWDNYFSVQYKGAANLSSKMIRVLPVDLKWSLGRCKIINLSNNSFSEIPASIQSLTKLESLNISQNILSGGFPQLKQLPNLTELDISGCYLPTLPEEVSHIKTLRRLNISKNALDGTFLERFALLSNLEWLNISETNALTLKHPNLKTLILNRNHINNYSFEGLPSLTEVSVASNSFTSLKPFAKLKNLENLDILNNYQEWDDLPKLKHLKQLKISLTEHRNSLELLKKLNRLTSLTLAISFLQLSTVFHLLTFVGAIKPVNDYFPDLNSEEKMIFSLIPQIFKPFDLSGLKLTEFHLEIRNLNTLLTFSRESCDDPWQISADFIEKKNYIPTKLEFFRCRDVYLGFDEEANIIFAPLLVYEIYKLQQNIPVQSFFVYQGNNICLALDDCGNLYTAKKKATIIANQVREFNEKLRLDEDGKLFHEDNKLRPISFRVRTFASVGVLHMFGDYEQNIWLLYNLNVDPCNITSKLPPEVDLPIVKIYALKESFYLIDSRGVVWVCDHLMQHAPNLDLITFSRLNFQDPVKFLWYDTAASSDIILVTTSGEVYVRSYDIKRYGILISKAEFNLLENVNIFIKAPPKSALK